MKSFTPIKSISHLFAISLIFFAINASAQIAGEDSVCVGDIESYTTTLTGTIIWSATPTGPTIVSSGSSATITWGPPAGVYTLTATDGTSTETLTVNVFAIPSPNIQYMLNGCSMGGAVGGDPGGFASCDTFCVGEIVNYSVPFTAGNTYQWTISNGTIISGAGTNSVNVQWNLPGMECGLLCLTETNLAGCTGRDCVRGVAGYPNGSVSISASPMNVCLNSPITFSVTATGGPFVSFYWDFGDGNTTTNGGPTSVTHSYNLPGTYTVILIASTNCCETSDTIQVTVDSDPGPDIYCISAVCADEPNATYCTSATGCTYNWFVTGGTIISGLGTSCITVNWGTGPVGTISLLTTGCSPTVCSDTTTVTVPIMPNGGFAINGPILLCVGVTGNYSAPYVPGSQYTWTLIPPSGPSTTLPYNTPPYIQNIIFNTAGDYTLICNIVNDILECEGTDSIKIKVRPDYSIFGPTTICAGSSGIYNSGTTVCNWTTTAPGNGLQTGTSANFIFTTPGTYTVTATALNPLAVCNSPQVITVTVNPVPPVPVITGSTVLCAGGTYSYSTSGYPASTTYSWNYIDNNFNTSSGTGNTFSITTANTFTSGTITLTVTDLGCSASTSINLSVPATPAPTVTGNILVCPDQVENYTAVLSYPGQSSVNWSISPAGAGSIISGQGTANVSIDWHSIASNITQTVTLTVTETICLTNSGSFNLTITIKPHPTITASGSNFCPGSSTTLNASGGVSYQWYNSSNVAISPTVSNPGNYYVVGTGANGCTAKAYVTVGSLSQPTASISTPDMVLCDTNDVMQNTINLYALYNTGYTYVWSPGASTSNPLSVSSTGIYSVIVTGTNGCSDTAFFLVDCHNEQDTCLLPICGCVNNPATIVQGSPNCNIFSFTANSTCAGTATWSFGDATNAITNSTTHTYTTAGYYNVCYNNSDFGCCPPAPACTSIAVPVGADFDVQMICNTLTVTDYSTVLPPFSISSWSWNWGDASSSSGQFPAPHTYTSAGPFTVTLTVTTTGGCQAQFTQIVNPAGPNVTASFSPNACNGPVNFTGTATGPIVDWSWDFGDTYGSNNQNPQHIYSTPGVYIVTLTGTDAAGCTNTYSDTITISAPPGPFNLIYTSPNCGSVLISVIGTYSAYQWHNNGLPINGATASTYLALQSGNYTVVVTDINGCIDTSNAAAVIVNPQPNIFLTVPSPICSGDAFIINSNVTGAFSFTWDIDGNPYFSGSSLSVPGNTLSSGPHTATVIAFDNITGCADTASINFLVNPSPTVYINNSDPSGVCSGDSINLAAVSPSAISYLWNTNSTATNIYVQTTGNYTVVVTDINGCTASAFSLATIHPLPDLSMLPIGCDSACIDPVADTIHGPPGMLSYNWQINNVTASTMQNLILDPTNMPIFGIPYTISLTATTINGCVDSTSFEYTPKDCDSSSCFDLEDTIECNADGTFTLTVTITNNSYSTSTYLWLHNITAPFSFSPAYIVPLTLLTGQTSSPIPITITFPAGPIPSTICYQASLYNVDSCCHDTTFYCIEVPICDPCDSVSVAADSTEGCCKTISITNNYSSTYFSGIQIIPITAGATIGSATLGVPYISSWTASGGPTLMNFNPNAGSIPMGTSSGLINLCLNIAPFTSSPQVVVINWMTPGTFEGDSVACSDTILFYCSETPTDPCGDIYGALVCNEDGTYTYNFTFTNNSTSNVNAIVFTSVTPFVTITPNPVLPGTPIPPAGIYNSSVVIDPGAYPAGTTICFELTLNDSTGLCCHTDTFCITLPDCGTCNCGYWDDLFSYETSSGFSSNIECNVTSTSALPGDTITFLTGGYNCIGDSTCSAVITWTLSGPNSDSGTGLPSFIVLSAGFYSLTIYAACGDSICDSCIINFDVADTTEDCNCGTWETLSLNDESGGDIEDYDVACGGTYYNTQPFGIITFTAGGFTCTGDSTCTPDISWTVSGPVASSGTGLPVFPIGPTGIYTLMLFGYCGDLLCDTCTITFVVEEDETCACGSWETFGATVDLPVDFDYSVLLNCGDAINDLPSGTTIQFVAGGYSCTGDPAVCASEINWTLTGPSLASGTGYPILNLTLPGTYTLSIVGSCGGTDCDTCNITFTVAEDEPICECGYWDDLFHYTAGDITGLVECNVTLTTVDVGDVVTFTSGTYHCTGDSCDALITWTLSGPSPTSGTGMPSFTISTAGFYSLTIYAQCGDAICDSCVINFDVSEECNCGSWDDFGANVDVPVGFDYSLIVECSSTYTSIPAGTIISFISGGYICSGDAAICSADYTWTLTGPAPASGTGYPVLNLTVPGTYILYMTASCGGNDCGNCKIKFVVVEGESCTCGSWDLFDIISPTKAIHDQPCGSKYVWKLNASVTINGNFNCIGPCSATYTWVINLNGVFNSSGSGMPITFTPTLPGTYDVFIYPTCGSEHCPPCKFRFKVTENLGVRISEDADLMKMQLIPNPAKDQMSVIITASNDTDGHIEVVNGLGVVMIAEEISLETGINSVRLELNEIPSGVYFVRYNNGSISIVERLIIAK